MRLSHVLIYVAISRCAMREASEKNLLFFRVSSHLRVANPPVGLSFIRKSHVSGSLCHGGFGFRAIFFTCWAASCAMGLGYLKGDWANKPRALVQKVEVLVFQGT